MEYAVSGSGSPTIRGILHYVNTWGDRPLSAMTEEQSTVQALRLLTSAAEFDSATGGVNREANLYPVIKLITAKGITTMPEADLKRHVETASLDLSKSLAGQFIAWGKPCTKSLISG